MVSVMLVTTCPTEDNEDQADADNVDSDTVGDVCDNTHSEGNPDQADGRPIAGRFRTVRLHARWIGSRLSLNTHRIKDD